MLWARQNGGENGEKEGKKEEKKKEKEEKNRGKIVAIYYIQKLQLVLYVLIIFNIVNRLYSLCMVGLGKAQ